MNIQKTHDFARANHNNAPKPPTQETQKKSTTMAADNTDKFDPTTTTHSNTYNKGAHKTDYTNVNGDEVRAKAGSSARQLKNDAVRSMVQSQVSGQVNKSGYKPLFGKNPVIANALQTAEATSAKHDDYWGVDATAERIFTFAKSLAGDDDEMFETMKDAFLKGFKQAEGAWRGAGGGKLPEISYQTKDKVLEMFDAWEKEIAAKKDGTEAKDNDGSKSSSSSKSTSKKEPIPYIGAGKYGSTGATAAPTKYSKGEKVPYIGIEKYGSSAKDVEPTNEKYDTTDVEPKTSDGKNS